MLPETDAFLDACSFSCLVMLAVESFCLPMAAG